jgi:hypothetical protein
VGGECLIVVDVGGYEEIIVRRHMLAFYLLFGGDVVSFGMDWIAVYPFIQP